MFVTQIIQLRFVDLFRVQYKHIGGNWLHPLYCPQFLLEKHKIERISCPVEGGGGGGGGVLYLGSRIREASTPIYQPMYTCTFLMDSSMYFSTASCHTFLFSSDPHNLHRNMTDSGSTDSIS